MDAPSAGELIAALSSRFRFDPNVTLAERLSQEMDGQTASQHAKFVISAYAAWVSSPDDVVYVSSIAEQRPHDEDVPLHVKSVVVTDTMFLIGGFLVNVDPDVNPWGGVHVLPRTNLRTIQLEHVASPRVRGGSWPSDFSMNLDIKGHALLHLPLDPVVPAEDAAALFKSLAAHPGG